MAAGGSDQILDAIGHFIRLKNGCQQFEKAHPLADAMLVLLTKDDARVFNATGGKVNVVSVIGAEDETEAGGPGKMTNVTVA